MLLFVLLKIRESLEDYEDISEMSDSNVNNVDENEVSDDTKSIQKCFLKQIT